MKTRLLLLGILCSGFFCLKVQDNDPKVVLQKTAALLKSKSQFAYQATYRIKYFDNQDTSDFGTFHCLIQKAPQDTVLGYYAKLNTANEERIYDGYNFLLISHGPKRILKDNPVVSGKKFTQNNINRSFIPSFFYSDSPFKTYVEEAKEFKMSTLTWGKTKVWKVEISLPTDEEITFLKRIVYIDQQTRLPLKLEGFAKYQNIQDEYFELTLRDISAKTATTTDFSQNYTYPQHYEEEIFKAPKINYDLLPAGADFIPIEGLNLQAKPLKIDEATIQDKLVLLDFWYLACGNCLLAMPRLSALSEKYQEKGLMVYGLNPYDDPKQKAAVAQKFLDKFKVSYTQVFVPKSLPNQYLIKVYPSMYLIKNGKVVYSHLGYSEAKMAELEAAIIEQLSEK